MQGEGRTNSFVGTAEYVSPEILENEGACQVGDSQQGLRVWGAYRVGDALVRVRVCGACQIENLKQGLRGWGACRVGGSARVGSMSGSRTTSDSACVGGMSGRRSATESASVGSMSGRISAAESALIAP